MQTKTNKFFLILFLALLCMVCCFGMTACETNSNDSDSKSSSDSDSKSSEEEHNHSYNLYGICSCGKTREVEVKVYIDGDYEQSVYTDANCNYKINAPEKPEDINTNPNSGKYFYGWFADSNYQTRLTGETTFKQSSKIYGKWITVYSDRFKYTVNNEKATITGYIGAVPSVLVVPAYINSFPVEAIGQDAFKEQTSIWSVIVCDGIKILDGFSGCKFMTDIEIPETITELNPCCFANCGLWHLDIPDSVTSIGNFAFSGCNNLTDITIPNSITSIGDYAFEGCSGLTSVTIGNSLTSIGDYAFYGCSGLTSISVAAGNAKYHSKGNCIIETETKILLLGCKNSVIPSDGSIASIGQYAFDGCSGLTSITIPDRETCSWGTRTIIENQKIKVGISAGS